MKKSMSLEAKVVGDRVVVSIGIETLAFAAQHLPALATDHTATGPYVKVTDVKQFAKDVCRKLSEEDEAGDSLISGVIDEAILAAIEDGSLGIEDQA